MGRRVYINTRELNLDGFDHLTVGISRRSRHRIRPVKHIRDPQGHIMCTGAAGVELPPDRSYGHVCVLCARWLAYQRGDFGVWTP